MKTPTAPYKVRVLAAAAFAALLSSTSAFAQIPSLPGHAANLTTPGVTAVDIRDIRGPEPLASVWRLAIWTGAGIAVASGAYIAWRRRQRSFESVKLPYESALVQLEAARSLMRPDSARPFSIVVSDIVRLYIEQRFHVMAAHRTTEEFLYDLLEPSHALLSAHRVLLAEFLNHCDLAKFGGLKLSAQEMESTHASARTFVLATAEPPLAPATTRKPALSPLGKDTYDSVSSA